MKSFNNSFVVLFLIGIGVLFRLRQYIFDRSLWIDEAMLALNLINKNYGQLADKLEYNQAAPLGFLYLQKFIVNTIGHSELALRLLPLLCGIAALYIVYFAASKVLFKSSALAVLAFAAVSYPLIYYSNELKQYMSDFLVAGWLLYLFISVLEKDKSKSYTKIAVTSAVLMWFSHPSLFIIGAGVSCILLKSLLNKQALRPMQLVSLILPVLASFAIMYFVNLQKVSDNEFLTKYWGHTFAVIIPDSFAQLMHNVNLLMDSFKHPAGIHWRLGGLILFLLGSVYSFKKNPIFLCLLVLPILMAFGASAFSKYPFNERFLLFAAPSIFIMIGFGLEWIIGLHKNGKYAALIIFCLLVYQGSRVSVFHFIEPEEKEEMRFVVEDLKQQLIHDQGIFCYYSAKPAFRYYKMTCGLEAGQEIAFGKPNRHDKSLYVKEISDYSSQHDEFWYVFSHEYGNEGDYIRSVLRSGHTVKDSILHKGASALLLKRKI